MVHLMKHRNLRGKIIYSSSATGKTEEFGREWFSFTWHEDGQITLRAHCEIEAGIVAERSVLRDVVYTMDSEFRPRDCFIRLHENGKFLGTGWVNFTDDMVEAEVYSALEGRLREQKMLSEPARSFGAHPVSCDMLHLPRYDLSRGPGISPQTDMLMSSLEHDGCSGPSICNLDLDLEYVGREEVTVPAGRFECDHFRFLLDSHPTEDLWCIPGTYVFVKITVGGYMAASFDLVSLETEY
jgi:hypothetical protein